MSLISTAAAAFGSSVPTRLAGPVEVERANVVRHRNAPADQASRAPPGCRPGYVTAWKRLHHRDEFDASGKPKAGQPPDAASVRRVIITPMDPARFPQGIFDGEKFLDAARKEGAKILVD